MFGFIFATIFTLAISFWCSLREALVLSTTTAEVEALKRAKPARGALTMENAAMHIFGEEIFGKDEVAVDMRELARTKTQKLTRSRRGDASARS